jgi:hypothetical protein
MNLSLSRGRADDDPLVVDPGDTARSSAVAAVDDALRGATGRELLSSAEAVRILADVRARVDEATLGDPVTRVLDTATAAFERDALIDGTRLEDALLDVRLALHG